MYHASIENSPAKKKSVHISFYGGSPSSVQGGWEEVDVNLERDKDHLAKQMKRILI